MKLDRLRLGQQGALDTVLSRIKAREPYTAIVLPTRYGKSDVIRLAALLSKTEGHSAGSIAFSPGEYLRRQLTRADKLDEMLDRYALPDCARNMRQMLSASEHCPFSNGEQLLSATIQLGTRNIDAFCELADSLLHQIGNPLIVQIDECHETSEEKRRGELVDRLVAAGALIVLYTATAIRADGELIPGFRTKTLSSDDWKRYVSTDAGDGIHNRIDVYEGERRVVELVADHTTTFQQAWNERPSPLCNLSREVIDVSLHDLADIEERILLSQCSPSRARQYLAKAVRNPIVIDKAVKLFVHALELRQRVNPDVAGLIFSCSDSNGESNQHAKEIAHAIAALRPDLQCCIVTMKSDEGDDKSTHQIERFVGVDGGHGKGDVLLVKQMGGAGLDASRIKVLLDLSPVRTIASVVQRLMRVATPWMGIRTASVITLADPLMNAIWQKAVTEQGGEAITSSALVDMEWIKSYLKLKEEHNPSRLEILNAEMHSFDDNLGQTGDLGTLAIVNELLSRIPALGDLHTKAELSDLLAGFSAPTNTVSPPAPLGKSIDGKQHQIMDRVKDLAQRDARYNPKAPAAWIERCKHWMNRAKGVAGVPLDVELSDIVNTTTLDVMLNFLAR